MAKELILLDTSVLIEYFRKKDKSKSYFSKLATTSNCGFAISTITEFEILFGSTNEQKDFWVEVFSNLTIFDLDRGCVQKAVEVQKDLKRKNQMIDIPDLLISATAIHHQLKIATNNKKHFQRIEKLEVVYEQ